MKVEVINTNQIIDVEFSYIANKLGENIKVYRDTFTGIEYYAHELKPINENDTNNSNYWEMLRHQAAISLMQGMISKYGRFSDAALRDVVNSCIEMSSELINGLKNEETEK